MSLERRNYSEVMLNHEVFSFNWENGINHQNRNLPSKKGCAFYNSTEWIWIEHNSRLNEMLSSFQNIEN